MNGEAVSSDSRSAIGKGLVVDGPATEKLSLLSLAVDVNAVLSIRPHGDQIDLPETPVGFGASIELDGLTEASPSVALAASPGREFQPRKAMRSPPLRPISCK